MLTIRLSRVGRKKQPTYRFIVSEKARDPWGHSLEILGFYNPRTNPATIQLKADRIQYWISKGATTSDTVNNLLIDQKVIAGEKRRIVQISQKRKKAIDAEVKAKEAAAEAAKPKPPAPEPEAAPAEAPAAEPAAPATPEAPAA